MTEKSALFVRLPSTTMIAIEDRIRATGQSKQSFVTGLLQSALTSPTDSDQDSVYDLEQVATLLRVPPELVIKRTADGLPGRRFDGEWRFSRNAVMRWLEGSDSSDHNQPGFTP